MMLWTMFGMEPVQLDHEPALELREFNARRHQFKPAANDPNYLIWRTAENHRIKTFVRGDGAQLSDAGKRRKEIRRKLKAGRIKRAWPKRRLRWRKPTP